MTVVVLNCHYKGPSAKSVPGWMKRYVAEMDFSFFATFVILLVSFLCEGIF